jgi:type IV pilus assembly protein PilE
VVIVAALLLVALPAYQNYVIRGHRAAAKAEMLEIANREQQYLLANRAYTANPANFSYTPPAEVAAKYGFGVTVGTDPPTFVITATPVLGGSQVSDGALTLNSEGKKGPADKWGR